jgi:hypothetical protein
MLSGVNGLPAGGVDRINSGIDMEGLKEEEEAKC